MNEYLNQLSLLEQELLAKKWLVITTHITSNWAVIAYQNKGFFNSIYWSCLAQDNGNLPSETFIKYSKIVKEMVEDANRYS